MERVELQFNDKLLLTDLVCNQLLVQIVITGMSAFNVKSLPSGQVFGSIPESTVYTANSYENYITGIVQHYLSNPRFINPPSEDSIPLTTSCSRRRNNTYQVFLYFVAYQEMLCCKPFFFSFLFIQLILFQNKLFGNEPIDHHVSPLFIFIIVCSSNILWFCFNIKLLILTGSKQ